MAHQLECFAYIAIARDRPAHAARLLGAAGQAREALHRPIEAPNEVAELEQALAQLAGALGEAERERLLAEGRRLSLDEAVLVALGEVR